MTLHNGTYAGLCESLLIFGADKLVRQDTPGVAFGTSEFGKATGSLTLRPWA